MSVYDFLDYKLYFNNWVEKLPKKGHGEYRRLAQALNVSTTMISHVFKSDKHLSLEMACEMCEYLNLNEDETDYFLLLVEYQKAGSYKLQKRLKRQLESRREAARKLEYRLKSELTLSEEEKAVFYSSWMYSGVRLLTDIETFNDANSIAERLHLPRNQVQKVIDFLIKHQLCVFKEGKLKMGPARTHIGSANLLVTKHHQNWRLQAFQKMVQSDEDNLFYTAPMVVSQEVADKIRQELPTFIEQINKVVLKSSSEVTRCLNIDWFEY